MMIRLAAVVLLLAGVLVAPFPAAAQGPVKIGVIQPLSGSVAASGNYVDRKSVV